MMLMLMLMVMKVCYVIGVDNLEGVKIELGWETLLITVHYA